MRSREDGARRVPWTVALRQSLILVGLITAVLAWLWVLSFGTSTDSFAYWSVDLANPWLRSVGDYAAFTYSPVVALAFAPFHAIPYPVFFFAWTTLLVVVALWLVPPVLWAPAFVLLLGELHAGNVHILMAGAIVLGLTKSGGWWAMPILLKVTPGVGLLWHLIRREWRPLGIAALVTGTLVALSLLIAPALWGQWFAFLVDNVGGPTSGGYRIEIAVLVRLPVAVAIAAYAAWSDRRWLVPIACAVALPVLWIAAVPAFVFAAARLRSGDVAEAHVRPGIDGRVRGVRGRLSPVDAEGPTAT